MKPSCTGADLRGFADTHLHGRRADTAVTRTVILDAAATIDELQREVDELRIAAATVEPTHSTDDAAALLLLRTARETAEQTIAEADRLHAEATSIHDRTVEEATARAEELVTAARVQAQHLAQRAAADAEARCDQAEERLQRLHDARTRLEHLMRQTENDYQARLAELRQTAESIVSHLARLEERPQTVGGASQLATAESWVPPPPPPPQPADLVGGAAPPSDDIDLRGEGINI